VLAHQEKETGNDSFASDSLFLTPEKNLRLGHTHSPFIGGTVNSIRETDKEIPASSFIFD
jgi:hypothetical protein